MTDLATIAYTHGTLHFAPWRTDDVILAADSHDARDCQIRGVTGLA